MSPADQNWRTLGIGGIVLTLMNLKTAVHGDRADQITLGIGVLMLVVFFVRETRIRTRAIKQEQHELPTPRQDPPRP